MHAGEPEPELGADADQRVIGAGRLLARQIELPAEVAGIVEADGERSGIADRDLLRGGEGKSGIGEIGVAHPLEQRAAQRPDDSEHGIGAGHVVDLDAGRPAVSLQPGAVAHAHRGAADHQEFLFAQPGHREVGLDAALVVQPQGIAGRADRAADVAGRQALQQRFGIRPMDARTPVRDARRRAGRSRAAR